MRIFTYKIFFWVILTISTAGQIQGEVSFVSAQHYYVRFDNTKGLAENDTLFFVDNTPVLLIKYLSERSGACIPIGEKELSKGDKVFGKNKERISSISKLVSDEIPTTLSGIQNNVNEESINKHTFKKPQQNSRLVNYRGRLSIQNYDTYTSNRSDFQRSRYSLSGKIENIAEVFSFSTYLHYSKNENFFSFNKDNKFNIYDLNINYHPDKLFDLWFGRYLNPKISSISAVDGVQAEKKFNSFFIGLLGGSRPDFNNMGYNLKLLEYGAYVGHSDTLESGLLESTLAVFQQTNNSAIDRRYIYLQHQNNIIKNFHFFFSSEIDFYTREKGQGLNKLSATSIYFNSRYAPYKAIAFSLSYDARKNVIYYETFRNIADSILDKETRQGIRFGINVRPFEGASFGINTGYRFKESDIKPTRNIGAHFSYSSIPLIKASGSANITKLITNYLDGLTYGINLSKQMFSNLSTTLSLRRIDYSFTHSEMQQNILSSDITFRLSKTFFLLAGYEVILEKKSTSQRILFDITARL